MPTWSRRLAIPVIALAAVSGPALAVIPLAVAEPAQAAGGCYPAGGRRVPEAVTSASSGIIVQGHGWGHSLGMSQYGAQGAARLGCSHAQILATYYRGTHLQRRTLTAPVVLSLQSKAVRSTVTAEKGGVTWSVTGTSARVRQPAGQTWTVARQTRRGRVGVALVATGRKVKLWTSAGVLRAAHGTGTVRLRAYPAGRSKAATDKRLRWGTLGFTPTGSGAVVVETIPTDRHGRAVDKYLWGLGEVPVSWPAEALRAQADAARTYLVGAYASGAYRIGTTTAAQVYTGATREDEDLRAGGAWHAAVRATSGELIVDASGVPIRAMYSSSDGGRSEDRAYVYGSQAGFGYLTGVDDSRWELASGNPHRSWAKAFSPETFAAALGFSSVSAVRLAAPGSSARDAGLRVTGVIKGRLRTVAFTGSALRTRLGLRSAAVTVRWVPPVPPTVSVDGAQPLAGDWDGDGRDEVGVYRSGQVSLRMADGTVVSYPFGAAGDTAVVGDWDGDGRDSVGVFRDGTWSLRNELSAGPADLSFGFGAAGDAPVAGRWAGPGRQGIGVVRGTTWLLRLSVSAGPVQRTFTLGRSGDMPVTGDWDGNGSDTSGVFRSGVFFLQSGLGSGTAPGFGLGGAGEIAVAGDWDGTGTDGVGVFDGTGFVLRDGAGGATTTVPFTEPRG